VPAVRAHGLGIIPYYPFESGFLTGRYRPGQTADGIRLTRSPREAAVLTPANFARLARWEAFAAERGRSMVELAVGWLLSHPEVGSVIAGASSPEQVRSTVESASWRLDASELEAVSAIG
jgi:aryl-alcohol dehydrogenase-like predicted oxidoreductase